MRKAFGAAIAAMAMGFVASAHAALATISTEKNGVKFDVAFTYSDDDNNGIIDYSSFGSDGVKEVTDFRAVVSGISNHGGFPAGLGEQPDIVFDFDQLGFIAIGLDDNVLEILKPGQISKNFPGSSAEGFNAYIPNWNGNGIRSGVLLSFIHGSASVEFIASVLSDGSYTDLNTLSFQGQNEVTFSADPVPVPAALPLFLGGLALGGGVLKRRRAVAS